MVYVYKQDHSDVEMRGRLLTALVALISQEEMIAMVGRLLEEDGLLLDTPYLRRMRAEGALMARRQSILDVLRFRFAPPVSVYQQLERYLETITDEAQLEKLLAVAARGGKCGRLSDRHARGVVDGNYIPWRYRTRTFMPTLL